jgi:very-short-patch-repair endonuclease
MYKCGVCNKSCVNKGGLKIHEKSCEKKYKLKKLIFNLYVNENWSINELKNKYKIGYNTINNIIGKYKRTISETRKLAHKKYSEKFKHSDETKEKLRKIRLDFIKNNPNKTAWRLKNISYPEKLFLNRIKELGLDREYNIIREYSFFPYFIDFVFLNEKIAVEIDGSQHLLPERKLKDQIKDKKLIDDGWVVIRFTENEVKTNIDLVFKNLLFILNNNGCGKNYYNFGVFISPKKYIKKKSNMGVLTDDEYKKVINQRKVKRPPYEQLIKEIGELGYSATGRKYGVSDNSIRKWKIFYEKHMVSVV